MQPGSNYTYISTATTTSIGGSAAGIRRCNLIGISINRTLAGALTVRSGATVIGIFPIGAQVGMQWYPDGGVEIADLQIVTAAADDITVFWNNL